MSDWMIRGLAVALFLLVSSPLLANSQEMRIGRMADWQLLDPHKVRSGAAREILELVAETPVRLGVDGRSIEPGFAARWVVSDDRKTYDFMLQDGLFFCSGRQATAKDVVKSIERWLNPAIEGNATHLAGPLASVTAPDEKTVRYRLTEPYSEFLYALTDTAHSLIDVTAASDPAFGRNGIDGTGPYCFVERGADGSTVLARKREWSRAGPGPALLGVETVPPSRLVFVPFETERELLDALMDGRIDRSRQLPYWALAYIREDPAFSISEAPRRFWSWHLGMVNGRPILSDSRVRKAIGMAIDLGPILAEEFSGEALPAAHIADPDSPDALPAASAAPFILDLDHADALLIEAGWRRDPDGRRVREGEPLDLVAYAPASGPAARMVAAVAGQLESLGISTTQRTFAGEDYWRALATGSFDLYVMGLPYRTAGELMRFGFASDAVGRTNRVGWQDRQTDNSLRGGLSARSESKRREYHQTLQRALEGKFLWVPIAHERPYWVMRKQ